jgi:hypothetical protein
MGLTFAIQAMNKLINPPLKKPINTVTDMIAAWIVDTIHIPGIKIAEIVVNIVMTLKTPRRSAIIPAMILPNTEAALSIEMR